jgi:hypothetical protein
LRRESRRFGDNREMRDELAAAPELARGRDPLQPRVRLPQICFRRGQQRSRAMQMAGAFTLALDAAQYFRLQRRPQSLDGFETILQRGLFQIRERGNAKLLVELEDLVRPQARDAEHFEHAGGNFLPHGLELRMCSRPM